MLKLHKTTPPISKIESSAQSKLSKDGTVVKERVIDRIRKLLELSKSTNEHEAALAAANAAALMLENQIEEAELDNSVGAAESATEEVIASDPKRVQWKLTLIHGLADSLGGFCFFLNRSYRQIGIDAVCKYKVIGTPSVINTVKYMFAYLVPEVERLAHEAYAEEAVECLASGVEAPSARAWKGSFRIGCAQIIAERLNAQRKVTLETARAEEKSKALAVIDKMAIDIQEFVKRKYPKMRKTGSMAGRRSQGGLEAGRAAGQKVQFESRHALK